MRDDELHTMLSADEDHGGNAGVVASFARRSTGFHSRPPRRASSMGLRLGPHPGRALALRARVRDRPEPGGGGVRAPPGA